MRKYILICFSLIFICMTLAGCKGKVGDDSPENDGTVVFTYGDTSVKKGEVYLYINVVKSKYETEYGENVWDVSLPDADEDTTMENMTREEVIMEIVKVKTFVSHAEEYDVRLSVSEEEQIALSAEAFIKKLTDEDLKELELNLDIVKKVMTENLIATKVWDAILYEEPVEISDEEARMTTFYDMYFPCYRIAEDGTVTPYTDEERTIQYENALEACALLGTSVINGDEDSDNIEEIAKKYNLKEAKEQTLSPEEVKEIYGESIFELLYSMDNGDFSQVIESEYGYHVFEMMELTDKKATAENKEELTNAAIDALEADKLGRWKKETDPDFKFPESVNLEVYDSIKLTN